MDYFPYTRFDFNSTQNYYYPLTFDYDNDRDKVRVIVADAKGVSYTLDYGLDYTLESDVINVIAPSSLPRKYQIDITKIFAIRISGICVTPEFNYGVYLDVKKVQHTLEAMALQLAEVQMEAGNSVKLPFEEWKEDNTNPYLIMPTVSERAGRILGFDESGKALMIREADLAETMQKYIKAAKDSVACDVSCLSFSFPATLSGYILPEEAKKFESVFSVTQGGIEYKAIESGNSFPPDKATFSIIPIYSGISGIEESYDTLKGTDSLVMDEEAATITVGIRYRDLQGEYGSFRKVISLTKSMPGKNGIDGADGISFSIFIQSSNGLVFRTGEYVDTTLTVQVLKSTEDITDTMEDSRFKWVRKTGDDIEDERWNTSSKALYHKSVHITTEDCIGRTVFECEVDLSNL